MISRSNCTRKKKINRNNWILKQNWRTYQKAFPSAVMTLNWIDFEAKLLQHEHTHAHPCSYFGDLFKAVHKSKFERPSEHAKIHFMHRSMRFNALLLNIRETSRKNEQNKIIERQFVTFHLFWIKLAGYFELLFLFFFMYSWILLQSTFSTVIGSLNNTKKEE